LDVLEANQERDVKDAAALALCCSRRSYDVGTALLALRLLYIVSFIFFVLRLSAYGLPRPFGSRAGLHLSCRCGGC